VWINLVERDLVIFNYAMDERSPVLAHQLASAIRLSKSFHSTTVVTAFKPKTFPPVFQGIEVISTNWHSGKKIFNLINFYWIAVPLLVRKRFNSRNLSVFSHMTDTQSALISPITRILKIKHVLWYAHTTLSWQLRFASLLVDRIVTSTHGSCPRLRRKVEPIGQAIDPALFPFNSHASSELVNGVHVGRLDRSKNLNEILDSCNSIRQMGFPITFTQIGSPSNPAQEILSKDLRVKYKSSLEDGWVRFQPSIPRPEIQEIFSKMDFFLHAYRGSLDKALLEATCHGLPVVTLNKEYIEIFGKWGNTQELTLESEFLALSKLNDIARYTEIERRAKIVVRGHSLDHWTGRMVSILSE
jgi:glycosyltransferase involved in cell wall biosynthesis